jgi:hypothetical protein
VNASFLTMVTGRTFGVMIQKDDIGETVRVPHFIMMHGGAGARLHKSLASTLDRRSSPSPHADIFKYMARRKIRTPTVQPQVHHIHCHQNYKIFIITIWNIVFQM